MSSCREYKKGELLAHGGLQRIQLKAVEGKRHTKRLNEKQIVTLLKVTCKRPHEQEAVQRNAYNEDSLAQEFGISIDERLATAEARVLPLFITLLGLLMCSTLTSLGSFQGHCYEESRRFVS